MVIAVRRPAGRSPTASPSRTRKNLGFFFTNGRKKGQVTKPPSLLPANRPEKKKEDEWAGPTRCVREEGGGLDSTHTYIFFLLLNFLFELVDIEK